MLLIMLAVVATVAAGAYVVHLVLILAFLRHAWNEGEEERIDAAARAVRRAGLAFPILLSNRSRLKR